MKKPTLLELAYAANIIDVALINNFQLEDIEQAKDKAWARMVDIEEDPFR